MAAAGEDVGEFEDDIENDDEESDALTHQYPLRENFSFELELLRDPTPREAERLAEHIKTLPF